MIRTTILGLVLLALPVSGAGQELRLTPFAARNGGLQGVPPLVGLSLSWVPGSIGLRFGGAVDAPYSPIAGRFGYERTSTLMAWSADADLAVFGDQAGLGLGRWGPSAFVGIGTHGFRRLDGSVANFPAWSYGLGLARPITSFLSLDVEARRRIPLASEWELPAGGVGEGWEFRAGVSLRIRGTRSGR